MAYPPSNPYPPPGGAWVPPPPIPIIPAQPPRPPTTVAQVLLGIGAILFTLLQFFMFLLAHGALDSSRPDKSGAASAAFGSLLLGVGAIAAALWVSRRRNARPLPLAILGGIGLFAGFPFAADLENSFDNLAGLGFFLLEGFILFFSLIPLIFFLVFIFGQRRETGWGIGFGLIVGHALFYLVSAIYVLVNLEQLARASEQAHESPAWGLVAGLATLLIAAILWRRTRDEPRP